MKNHPRILSPIALIVLVSSVSAESSPGANWPAFRGAGDGVTPAKNLPAEWAPDKNIGWKIDLPGYGQSAPVVWGNHVYVTAVSGDNREKGFVLAYDATTGKELWRHEFETTQKAKWGYTISRGAPTPCADANGLYAFFEGGNLIAFTHEGKVRWERSLVTDHGEFKGGHGVGSSPAQTADTLFLLIDHAGPCYLLAVEKATGKTKWKTDRTGKMSWTSPVIAMTGGHPVVVASSNGSVAGYAADTGKEVWRVDDVTGNTIPSASVLGDVVLVGAGANRGGKESAKETKSNCCLSLTSADGKPGITVKWTAKPGLASYATPLAHQGVAYFVNEVGVISGHDLQTGKSLFSERTAGPCWASPIAAGDRVYFFGKNGTTTVLKAGKSFEVIATNKLWTDTPKPKSKTEEKEGSRSSGGDYADPVLYGVAAADSAFFVRTGTSLYRIGK
ncbi:outer membrane protein assembly factor BamB family protein [Zavarzinella formosa]|uniref:outer membrane protein assembly factor BamB family protein n=1 Tax=Zavarzinella formosa TaxID=360055 RepID=UPI0007C5A290|nr:PQQ-binding-like beta-propeller repeat protein [Zavarzinella formosa]